MTTSPTVSPTQAPSSSPPTPSRLWALVRTARPRQWLKNCLVAVAPLAAGRLFEFDIAVSVAIAFVAFCVTSSGVYYINDAIDVEQDRAHEKKRHRPVAAGVISVLWAYVIGVLLLATGIGLGAWLSTWQFGVVLACYAVMSIAYCVLLKDQPIIDLVVIAMGFLLRAMSGGLATDILLSDWFLFVASFGSLFIAAGKRYSEAIAVGADAKTRRSLAGYSVSYLRFVWGSTAAVTITGYALWAFEMRDTTDSLWPALSIVPFVIALLRYAKAVDAGEAQAPEDIFSRDRALQFFGVVWLVLLVLSTTAAN